MTETNNNTIQDSKPAAGLTVGQLKGLVREVVERALCQNGYGENPQSEAPKPYLTIQEGADLARLAPSTIRLYIRKRKLKAIQVGSRVIIKRTDLERFLEADPLGTDEN